MVAGSASHHLRGMRARWPAWLDGASSRGQFILAIGHQPSEGTNGSLEVTILLINVMRVTGLDLTPCFWAAKAQAWAGESCC